jgi:chemotaxis response regulator CheB
VVLSGALDDGAAGLAAIKRAGGLGIVQDPEDAVVRDMPVNAIPSRRWMPHSRSPSNGRYGRH